MLALNITMRLIEYKTIYSISKCCITPILSTKTQNSINNDLFISDFREVFLCLRETVICC